MNNLGRVLLLVGSKRRRGNSDYLARTIERGLKDEGSQTRLIYLDQLRLCFCRGCLSCVFKEGCVLDDDLPSLVEEFLKAEGLVVAAPTYLFSPGGIIKTLIDRALVMSSHLEKTEKSRRFSLSVSVAGNQRWNHLGVEFLNLLGLAYHYRPLDYLEAYAPGPGEVLLQDEVMVRARKLGSRLSRALAGEEEPREAEPAQCPLCYSRSLRFEGQGKLLCPFCGIKGTISQGLPEFDLSAQDSFWSHESLRDHLVSWIEKTGVRFKEQLPRIREARRDFEEADGLHK